MVLTQVPRDVSTGHLGVLAPPFSHFNHYGERSSVFRCLGVVAVWGVYRNGVVWAFTGVWGGVRRCLFQVLVWFGWGESWLLLGKGRGEPRAEQ